MSLVDRCRVGTAIVAATAWLLAAACGSDNPTRPPGSTTRPLGFEYFIHPGTLQVGTAASIRAGVFVGPDLCWGVGEATLTQKGDSLVLAGLGVYRPGGGACPDALAYDSVLVALPRLAAGRYLLVADDLVDTLVVTPTVLQAAAPEAFAAHGRVIISLIPEACPRFACRFAGFDAVAGFLDAATGLPPGSTPGVATGDLGPEVLCVDFPPPARRVHLRSFRAGPSNGDTHPLVFDYFLHPGVLDANSPGQLEAGVLVGPDGCWNVLDTGLTVHGDSLRLAGVAIYGAPPGVGCTDALVHAVVRVTIPPLPAGRYVIAADALLADTLEVASPAPRPSGKRFVSYGQLCPPAGTPVTTCPPPQFRCRFEGFSAVEGDLENPWPLVRCSAAVLAGTIVDEVPCETHMRQRIHRRGLQLLERDP